DRLAQFEAEVVEVTFRRRMGAELVDNRPEVRQGNGPETIVVRLLGESGGEPTQAATRPLLRVAALGHRGGGGRTIDPRHSLAAAYPADRCRASAPKGTYNAGLESGCNNSAAGVTFS